MYGLSQAGILANKLLKQRLSDEGYHEQPHTPGLFRHEEKDIYFTLVVDDIGIKYGTRDCLGPPPRHIETTHNYIEIDWKGEL